MQPGISLQTLQTHKDNKRIPRKKLDPHKFNNFNEMGHFLKKDNYNSANMKYVSSVALKMIFKIQFIILKLSKKKFPDLLFTGEFYETFKE